MKIIVFIAFIAILGNRAAKGHLRFHHHGLTPGGFRHGPPPYFPGYGPHHPGYGHHHPGFGPHHPGHGHHHHHGHKHDCNNYWGCHVHNLPTTTTTSTTTTTTTSTTTLTPTTTSTSTTTPTPTTTSTTPKPTTSSTTTTTPMPTTTSTTTTAPTPTTASTTSTTPKPTTSSTTTTTPMPTTTSTTTTTPTPTTNSTTSTTPKPTTSSTTTTTPMPNTTSTTTTTPTPTTTSTTSATPKPTTSSTTTTTPMSTNTSTTTSTTTTPTPTTTTMATTTSTTTTINPESKKPCEICEPSPTTSTTLQASNTATSGFIIDTTTSSLFNDLSSTRPTFTNPTSTSDTSDANASQGESSSSEPTTLRPTDPPVTKAASDCMANCISTPEYNPVCGTNGETYKNIGQLQCAKTCGIDVDLKGTSACPPVSSSFDVSRDRTTTTRTLTTTPVRIVRASSLSAYRNCMMQCPINNPDYNPVCGTDSVTYFNIERLNCARACGQDIQVLCGTSCATCVVARVTTTSTTTSEAPVETTKSNDVGRITPLTTENPCLRSCPITTEFNPICGTNGITYPNPSHLLCAQVCGEDVRVLRFAACGSTSTQPPTSTTTTTTTEANTVLAPGVASCITQCQVTNEYNPVCGTNGVTYENPGRLLCAKYCGVNVELRASLPCFLVIPIPESTTMSTPSNTNSGSADGTNNFIPTSSPIPWIPTTTTTTTTTEANIVLAPGVASCLTQCQVTTEYSPVCGTNGVTYDNLGRLRCAKNCGVNVELRASLPCFLVIPMPESTTMSTPSNTNSGSADDTNNFMPTSSPIPWIPTSTPVESPQPTPPSSIQTTSSTTSKPSIDFTIPSEILASIFPMDINSSPRVTKSVTPATEETTTYDIDPRLGNGGQSTTPDIQNEDDGRLIFPDN